MDNYWYVYKHVRLDTNKPFYIGIGKKKNYGRAYEINSKRNIIWFRIVAKTDILIEILYSGLTKEIAALKEIELIKEFGRIDNETGILANMTDGGDGIWNCIRSSETREKISKSKMGKNNPQYGKKQSIETIAKKVKKLTGLKRSGDTKLKQSLASILSGQAKEIDVFDYYTNEYIGRFYAIKEACRVLGIEKLDGKASMVAKGKRNRVKNYVFKYVIK